MENPDDEVKLNTPTEFMVVSTEKDVFFELDDIKPKKIVSFHEDTKPFREFIPGPVLANILDMELNGIFSSTNNFRSGIDLFNSLTPSQKIEVLECTKLLKDNIIHMVKKKGFMDSKITIPLSPTGQINHWVKIDELPQILKIISLFEINL